MAEGRGKIGGSEEMGERAVTGAGTGKEAERDGRAGAGRGRLVVEERAEMGGRAVTREGGERREAGEEGGAEGGAEEGACVVRRVKYRERTVVRG